MATKGSPRRMVSTKVREGGEGTSAARNAKRRPPPVTHIMDM